MSIAQFVASLVVDCKYSDHNLEAALRDTYGENRSIVDSDIAAHTGALVGVTLTSIDSTSTFVVTNYNGAGPARDDPGVCIEKQQFVPSLTQRKTTKFFSSAKVLQLCRCGKCLCTH